MQVIAKWPTFLGHHVQTTIFPVILKKRLREVAVVACCSVVLYLPALCRISSGHALSAVSEPVIIDLIIDRSFDWLSTDHLFRYASLCLWNQLSASFRPSYRSCSDSPLLTAHLSHSQNWHHLLLLHCFSPASKRTSSTNLPATDCSSAYTMDCIRGSLDWTGLSLSCSSVYLVPGGGDSQSGTCLVHLCLLPLLAPVW